MQTLYFHIYCQVILHQSFSGGSDSKESACNEGDLGSIPGLGRSPGGGRGNPLQYSCLENPHGQRSLEGWSMGSQIDMTERLSTAQHPSVRLYQFILPPSEYECPFSYFLLAFSMTVLLFIFANLAGKKICFDWQFPLLMRLSIIYVSMTFAIFFLFLWIAFIFSVHIPVGMFDHFNLVF